MSGKNDQYQKSWKGQPLHLILINISEIAWRFMSSVQYKDKNMGTTGL